MNKKTTFIVVGLLSTVIIGSGLTLGLYFGINKTTQLFIAIHCEPGSLPQTTQYQELYWDDLVTMMFHANANNVKLNLLFNPQWASYILPNSTRLNMVRSWESYGHELGMHVHGPHMNSWCGYTNQVIYQNDSKYIGTISDMMSLMNQLPIGGQIHVTCSNDDDITYDYPTGVPYSTMGGAEKTDHLWSKPTSVTVNDQLTTPFAQKTSVQLTHARYGNVLSDVNIDFEEFKELYTKRNREYVMGLVWHVFNFADNPIAFIQLFEYLGTQNMKTWTISEIINN